MNSNEMIALDVLNEMLRLYPSAFTALKEYSWLSDTISADEFEGILGLLVIVDRFPPGDPSLLQALSETSWLHGGIGPSEAEFLNSVARNMEKPANKIDSFRNPVLREIPSYTPSPRPTRTKAAILLPRQRQCRHRHPLRSRWQIQSTSPGPRTG